MDADRAFPSPVLKWTRTGETPPVFVTVKVLEAVEVSRDPIFHPSFQVYDRADKLENASTSGFNCAGCGMNGMGVGEVDEPKKSHPHRKKQPMAAVEIVLQFMGINILPAILHAI